MKTLFMFAEKEVFCRLLNISSEPRGGFLPRNSFPSFAFVAWWVEGHLMKSRTVLSQEQKDIFVISKELYNKHK